MSSSGRAETRIGLLHPGTMGASIGAALRSGGHTVCWVAENRSAATAERAQRAGLEGRRSLDQLCADVDAVVSVCPPEAAMDLARSVAATGFRGIYVDANAISPAAARAISALLSECGVTFVDGGIVGPPAWRAGTTRLFLSGEAAARVTNWFSSGPLECTVVGREPGPASALKMCYAAYTKGTSALLLAIRALAEREGVADALATEWARSQPGLAERLQQAAAGSAPKAWRFVAEMEEIAQTFADAGLAPGFHLGAADIYRRLEQFKDREGVRLHEVVGALLQRSERRE